MTKFDFSIIKTLRAKAGLTAEELARRAEVTRATVAKLESGSGNPTMETIEALSRVFQLTSSELVRLAEVAQCEAGVTESFEFPNWEGMRTRFPNFELYVVRMETGSHKDSDPRYHENTAEICMVLSGKVRVNVSDQCHILGTGMAVRFNALHDHSFDILEKAEFLLIHHVIV